MLQPEKILYEAHDRCPYFNAARGNIDVKF